VLGSAFDDEIVGDGAVNGIDGGPGYDDQRRRSARQPERRARQRQCTIQVGDGDRLRTRLRVRDPVRPRPSSATSTSMRAAGPRARDQALGNGDRRPAGQFHRLRPLGRLTVRDLPRSSPARSTPAPWSEGSRARRPRFRSASSPSGATRAMTTWLDGSYPAALIANLDGGPGSDTLAGTPARRPVQRPVRRRRDERRRGGATRSSPSERRRQPNGGRQRPVRQRRRLSGAQLQRRRG
jgi:hypothetical protein